MTSSAGVAHGFISAIATRVQSLADRAHLVRRWVAERIVVSKR